MDKERSRRVRWLLLLLLLLLLVVVVDMPDELTVKPDVPCVPCVLQRELSRPSRTTHYCQWKRKPNEISELFLTVVSPVVRHTRDSRAHRTSNYLSQRWRQRRQRPITYRNGGHNNGDNSGAMLALLHVMRY
jgi:hypothetical protein